MTRRLPPVALAALLLAVAVAVRGLAVWARTDPPPPPPGATWRVPLNRATADDLRLLPGVGPAVAQRIATHRDAIGGFDATDRLDDVSGVGPVTLERVRPWVGVDRE